MEKRNGKNRFSKTNNEIYMICQTCSKSHLICGLDINCECCKITLEKIKLENEKKEFNLLYQYLKYKDNERKKQKPLPSLSNTKKK